MKFLLDTQLPRSLAFALHNQNYEVSHVLDLKMAQCSDNELWEFAFDSRFVIVTKDEDFSEWVDAGRLGPAIVWLRIGNCSNEVLSSWLLPLMPEISKRLNAGERLIEVR